MKNIFNSVTIYVRQLDWTGLALLKFCLCAFGVLIGLALPKRARKSAALLSFCVFIATCLPLMLKFASVVQKEAGTARLPDENHSITYF